MMLREKAAQFAGFEDFRRKGHMVDFYAEATDSFEQHLHWIEEQGRRESPDWQLVRGLLRLAQGLRHDHDEEEDRRKCFARTSPPRK